MLAELSRAMKKLVAAVEDGSNTAIITAAKVVVEWHKRCWSSRR